MKQVQDLALDGVWSLHELLRPVTGETFLTEVMGITPLHVVGTRDKFIRLLSWQDLNEILAYSGFSPNRLRLYNKAGQNIPSEMFCTTSPFEGARLFVAEFNALLSSGATFTIQAVEELHIKVARLCHAIERDLEISVQANVCSTWNSSASFGLRWNDHDIFVLQVFGNREWQLHAPTSPFPVAGDTPPQPTTLPVQSMVVRAGDLLYIPRGWWHQDYGVDQPSLYLNVGFRNPTGIDLANRVVQHLRETTLLRMDYPRYKDVAEQGKYLTQLQREIVNKFAEPGLLLGYLKDYHASAEPKSVYGLPWGVHSDLPEFAGDYRVISRVRFPGDKTVQHSESGNVVVVRHGRKILHFDSDSAPIICRLLDDSVKTLDDIFLEFGDHFTRHAIAASVTDLARAGLVVLQSAEDITYIPS